MTMTTDKTYRKDVVNNLVQLSATVRPMLSGRDCHVSQVTSDRHQASARKLKDQQKIGDMDGKNTATKGEVKIIKQEMEMLTKYSLGLTEVRWEDAGKMT